MSLLNQMLNDLESRRAEQAGPVMHREVRPLPVAKGAPLMHFVAIGLGIGLVISGAAWYWFSFGPGRPLVAVAPAIAAKAVEATLPVLEAPALPPIQATAPLAELAPAASAASASPSPAGELAPPSTPTPASSRVAKLPSLRFSQELTLPDTGKVESALPPPPAVASASVLTSRDVPASGGIEKKTLEALPSENAERAYRAALGLLGQGREHEGLTVLRSALKDDPAHLGARQLLIKYYIDSRSYDAAQGVLEDGLKVAPKQVAWALLLSRLKADRGDNATGLAVLEAHEAHALSSADYQGAMGALLQRLNRLVESEQRFMRAAQIDPAAGRWWVGVALAREAQGKSSESREAFRTALAAKGLSADLRAFAEAKLK